MAAPAAAVVTATTHCLVGVASLLLPCQSGGAAAAAAVAAAATVSVRGRGHRCAVWQETSDGLPLSAL
eukprot:COSAG01_NODE_5791_length_4033_cov_4.156329_7_plen_68_part_00